MKGRMGPVEARFLVMLMEISAGIRGLGSVFTEKRPDFPAEMAAFPTMRPFSIQCND
jgi:hypothetical protein